MLHRGHLISALRARREDFANFERTLGDEVGEAAGRLRELGRLGSAEVAERVAGPGASRVTYPSAELDGVGGVVVPFGQIWGSHEEARRWARKVLEGRTTFAADGSQIFPDREVSVPVAAVQVASFENPHSVEGDYAKEIHVRIITPEELLEGERAYESRDQVVGFKRFEAEADAIRGFMLRKKGWRERGERVPVAFLDGTLLISSQRKNTEVLFFKYYAAALVQLVKLSRETEVPVVGYVDQSYAPDLRNLLEALHKEMRCTRLYDAQMLGAGSGGGVPLLAGWGDRTIFWHCRRTNLAEEFYDEDGRPLVGFVYLQTTSDGAPSRLDVPAWVYEAGLLDEVADAVRAECVVGNGYPYAVETADAAAVMTARDREEFLRVMQEFAERESLAFRVSRKAGSKMRRR